jgi:hypothetical protein
VNEHCLVTGNSDWLTERQSIFTTLERDREGCQQLRWVVEQAIIEYCERHRSKRRPDVDSEAK